VAEATVNELSIGRIRLGMAAETRIDSLGRTFAGTVQKVATANLQDWRSDEKQYATEVSLGDTKGLSFRPGMSARVTFHVDHLTGVLTVPVEAVFQKQGKSWCSVAGAPREVELGPSSDERVVVAKGLAEGETVEVLAVEPGG
jgi:multidrug efflux pump subunit AcrA (membrane-fusion protein)